MLPRHIPALDGVRGLAILLVMLYHYSEVLPTTTAIDAALKRVAEVGGSGVSLFFVLSGFLITGILLDSKGRRGYFSAFFARRALRIFPLYYALLTVLLVIGPLVAGGRSGAGAIGDDAIWYWLFLSNFAIARAGEWRHASLDISWSLSVEEQFYLIWPAVILLCSRRMLTVICCAMMVFSPAFRLTMLWLDMVGLTFVLTAANLDGLGLGALIALQVRRPFGVENLRRWLPRLAMAAVAFVVFAYALTLPLPMWDASLIALYGVLVATCVVTAPGTRFVRALEWSWLGAWGTYSYALYLFHQPIRQAVLRIYPAERFFQVEGSAIPGLLLFMVMAGGLTFATAWLSWHLFESRILSFERHFTYEDAAPGNLSRLQGTPS